MFCQRSNQLDCLFLLICLAVRSKVICYCRLEQLYILKNSASRMATLCVTDELFSDIWWMEYQHLIILCFIWCFVLVNLDVDCLEWRCSVISSSIFYLIESMKITIWKVHLLLFLGIAIFLGNWSQVCLNLCYWPYLSTKNYIATSFQWLSLSLRFSYFKVSWCPN